ncbi:unnamed protein product [Diatraea saccharalis]|uniref:THAP-type domain-containing protein n=1 Tax=Diatraea saccharalis TaxID=40085 RepID=A0A9N9R214_9NEOP|nr:unnamed protein product [Diatraea saccharalis]
MSFTQSYKTKEHATEYSESKTRATPVAMVAPELKHSTEVNTEITKNCAVLGCDDSKNLDPESFFRFPEDANLRQIWTDLTGRNNWTPTDYSYICIQHFSVDCFECDSTNTMVLVDSAVPSLKLPNHVLEVEYIDEESLDNEYNYEEYMDTDEFEDEEATPSAVIITQSKGITQINRMAQTNSMGQANSTSQTNSMAHANSTSQTNSTVQTHTTTQTMSTTQTSNYTQTNNAMETNGNNEKIEKTNQKVNNVELLKLFTEVQKMQRQAVGLKEKLKTNMQLHNRQNRHFRRLEEILERKKKILEEKQKKKSKILLTLQDKVNEDMSGLVLAMPMRQTEDLKNFALNIYNYSPQAYIYLRNTLRTMLPSTDVMETWLNAGFQPKSIMSSSNMVKVTAEQTEKDLICKVSIV